MITKKRNTYKFLAQEEKTETGFFGSLILTAEHILGNTAGTLPVIGLFFSSIGAFASILWWRNTLTPQEIGLRVLMGLVFLTLAIIVITLPATGMFVGLSVAGYSAMVCLIQWKKHRGKTLVTKEQHRMLQQKATNAFMSLIVLGFIITALFFPPSGIALLVAFLTLSLAYVAYSFKENFSCLFYKDDHDEAKQVPSKLLKPETNKSDTRTDGEAQSSDDEAKQGMPESNQIFRPDQDKVQNCLVSKDIQWASTQPNGKYDSSAPSTQYTTTLLPILEEKEDDEDDGDGVNEGFKGQSTSI